MLVSPHRRMDIRHRVGVRDPGSGRVFAAHSSAAGASGQRIGFGNRPGAHFLGAAAFAGSPATTRDLISQ